MHLFLLSLSHFAIDVLLNLLPPLLPHLIRELGLSVTLAGALVSMRHVSNGLGQPLCGHFLDRRGRAWMVPLTLAWVAAAMGLFAITDSYILLFLFMGLAGLGGAFYHPLAATMVRPAAGRLSATAFSVFQIGGTLGMTVAPGLAVLALGAFGRPGIGLLGLGALAVAATFILGGTHRLPLPNQMRQEAQGDGNPEPVGARDTPKNVARSDGAQAQGSPDPDPRRSLRWLALLCISTILRTQTLVALSTFIPLYYSLKGHPDEVGAAMLTLFMIAGSAGSVLGAILADRVGHKFLQVGSLLLCTPAVLGFLWLPAWSTVFLVVSSLNLFAVYSAGVVYGQQLVPSRPGLASGVLMGFVWGLCGAGILPISALVDQYGMETVLRWLAWLPALGLPFLFPVPDPARLRARRAALQGSGSQVV